jgi:very-short-patch-repair endonuclease
LLELEKSNDPEFSNLFQTVQNGPLDKRITIKNIENIQGDERDTMIFSVAYARNRHGNLIHQFGNLSKAGGENRLNVAITRAVKKMIIVCSIHPNELNINEDNKGPYLFKQFLKYAYAIHERNLEHANGVLLEINNDMKERRINQLVKFDSNFENQVYDELLKLGYKVDTQVGASQYRIDLSVVHPDHPSQYIVGIECDGATYHSSKSARERDVYRQKFLEKMGWKILRIWSRNWWINPEREIQRIHQEIQRLQNARI